MIVVLGRIHALMMVSNVLEERSVRGKDRRPQLPLNINKDPCSLVQPASTTLLPAEAALIYFHIFVSSPPQNPANLQ
jgi:hypothetical protein